MSPISEMAVESVNKSLNAFCKFISANDAGQTGAHQAGFYMPKNTWPLMFDSPGEKGSNRDRNIVIKWQDNFETRSRFIYYGTGSRNEYRLTRFGRGFPFLTDDNVGDLMILCHIGDDYYEGYVLQADEDIDDFFAALSISSSQTNRLIKGERSEREQDETLDSLFTDFIRNFHGDFPSTESMSEYARTCFNRINHIHDPAIIQQPDRFLLEWIDAEFKLFKAFENDRYTPYIKTPFDSVETMIKVSNMILNRRKSRAGKSLEHHLSQIFTLTGLRFESQVITEGNKKPDFIFPDGRSYHDQRFLIENLVCLGVKTTCKDRWRQILNEADRIPIKHLFTLQQGISTNQLSEMYTNNVRLVVPRAYLSSFDRSFQGRILTLERFNMLVRLTQQGNMN